MLMIAFRPVPPVPCIPCITSIQEITLWMFGGLVGAGNPGYPRKRFKLNVQYYMLFLFVLIQS